MRLPYELVEETPQVVTEISGLERVKALLAEAEDHPEDETDGE